MTKLTTSFRLFCLTAVFALAASAAPILTLSPGPDITGAVGSTIGWGFTLTNDSNWIEVTKADFCLDVAPGNGGCFLTSASFTDIMSVFPNDVIVGPSGPAATVTQAYDPSNNLGVGSFLVGASKTSGFIYLTYGIFDADPNAGGNFLTSGNLWTAASAGPSAGIPEPATMGLAGLALAGLALRLRRRG